MGLFKAFKAVKSLAQAGTPDGHAPKSLVGGLQAVGEMMAAIYAPMWALITPERGQPLPGTEPAALAFGDAAALASGLAGISARDSAFDTSLLTTFADQVFAAMVEVWQTNDPGTVRGVLADGLWNPLAAAATTNQTLSHGRPPSGLFALAILQQGKATLAGAHAGSWYDTVTFAFGVRLGPGAPPMAQEPWQEEWLFQRSAQPGGDPMAPPETCPMCGAPSATDAAGACTRCRTPMPVCTSGWLVSRVECHNPFLQAEYDKTVASLRADPSHLQHVPAQLRQLLPADLRGPTPPPIPA